MKRNSKVNSSCKETDDDPTHPAVLGVFRIDNILEEICRYLDFNDLKQFRLVSTNCNSEGRRALKKRDRHWVVVKSTNVGWHTRLDKVSTNLEKTTEGGENSHQQSLGWIFKRFYFYDWEQSLGHSSFLRHRTFVLLKPWVQYLTKIHLIAGAWGSTSTSKYSTFQFINAMHQLTARCPNLDELVVEAENYNNKDGPFTADLINQVESLEFPSPLLKLRCIRVKNLWTGWFGYEERTVLQRFFAKLVRAAVIALERFQIDFDNAWVGEERDMLASLALNVGVSNFQSLKEITLESSGHVGNLSYTVQKSFPELTKLILYHFYSGPVVPIRPKSFPAVKSLTIHDVVYQDIINGNILNFLQNFQNLEVLALSSGNEWADGLWPVIPDPADQLRPVSRSVRSFTFKTGHYNLRLLRCAVNMFPNLVTLNLLGFGRRSRFSREPKYSFGELIDIISPLSRLRHLYINHAFHTSPQLVDAIQLSSNLTALETLIISQAAHDNTEQDFNVSLYLSSSDPEFLYILDCECVTRLQSVRLLNFRFGTTQEEVEEEAVAKGGHVSFVSICPCYVKPWICDGQSPKPFLNLSQLWKKTC